MTNNEKLKEIRLSRGLTQTGLASEIGCSLRTIQRMESGKSKVGDDLIRAIKRREGLILAEPVTLLNIIADHKSVNTAAFYAKGNGISFDRQIVFGIDWDEGEESSGKGAGVSVIPYEQTTHGPYTGLWFRCDDFLPHYTHLDFDMVCNDFAEQASTLSGGVRFSFHKGI